MELAKKYRDEPQKFWDKVLWTDETKINFDQKDGKAEVWIKKGSAHDPKNTSSSVKHGGGDVMAWASMASSGTGSLIFIDDVTHDGSSKMTSEVHRNILSAILKRCNRTNWEILHHAARQNTLPKLPRSSPGERSGRFENGQVSLQTSTISSISPAKEETEGRNPLKQTTTERGCGESLEKHHRRRMQTFGDVSGSQA